jgi:hypothetical protein
VSKVPQNIFKIYDGRTNFWQWDTKQKLIVLDERVTEVRFSNRNMEHSKRRPVYKDKDGVRICNVPDVLLQLPKNLIAYAVTKNEEGCSSTIKAVKFAVHQQPIPTDYICEQDAVVEEVLMRIELLETLMKDVETGAQQLIKFNSLVEAALWATEKGEAGNIIVVKLDIGWVPHVVEDDKSLTPICNCEGEEVVLVFDGDDADGHPQEDIEDDDVLIQYFDGGSAAGV